MNVGEVWFARFPLEEDPSRTIDRPVVILDVDKLEVLSVKVTKHPPRPDDLYDVPIVYGDHANLRFKSTARVSKTMYLQKSDFRFRIGTLHPDDFKTIQSTFIRFINDDLA